MNSNIKSLLDLGGTCTPKEFNKVWKNIENDSSISTNTKKSLKANIDIDPGFVTATIDYSALTI